MKKDVIISIRGLQEQDGETGDPITLVTPGRYYRKNDSYYISYEESELTGLAGTRTTLRVKSDFVKLVRTGLYPSELQFELGKRHMSLYHTDYGDLSIVVSTNHIRNTLTDDGGDLDVQYTVEVANTPVGVNHLSLTIKNAEEGAIYQ
ncbi:MAG: DUF1934 domain-containing protein [Clostridia bacterium]|nr:DUF1934 domain-containing protein [Clostridia bacterium]